MNLLNGEAAESRGYAPVNGLKMYYEIEGAGEGAGRGLPCSDTATPGCVIHAPAGVPVPPKLQGWEFRPMDAELDHGTPGPLWLRNLMLAESRGRPVPAF
jgi:hypothetical protein